MSTIDRRAFLTSAAAAAVAFSAGRALQAADSSGEGITIGVMGLGRGADLVRGFSSIPGLTIKYLCDVDESRIAPVAKALEKKQKSPATAVKDFRRILDDKNIDVLAIAAPDHWHGPATILACAAGKHVYVEKPASHNAREGEWMVEAARKYKRVVQLGSQRRSYPSIIEAIDKVKNGAIGRVTMSRGWYNATRGSIGRGKEIPVPGNLDYDLWEGPAPHRPYRSNLLHYNWHWFWHWGTGELGNNGIHSLDLCRWGLEVDYPKRVTSGGGRYHFADDQETPDTQVVTYDFGDKFITWEGRSCHPRGFEGSGFGVAFYGDKGTLVCDGAGSIIYDLKNKEVEKIAGKGGDGPHFQNFLDCIRSGQRPAADIEEGHKSTLLCHLGNIAQRTGRVLNLDPKTGQLMGDPAADDLWGREYRPGWVPKV